MHATDEADRSTKREPRMRRSESTARGRTQQRRRSLPFLRLVCACLLVVACAGPPGATRIPAPSVRVPPDAAHAQGVAAGVPLATSQVLPAGVAIGVNGAVATAERHASAVGLDVLARGGNAVDAAIAIGFALAVTHPAAGNVGGGGFMLVWLADGRSAALDFREVAPRAATADMFLDAQGNPTRDSVLGARAAGVAGTVAGFGHAHEQWATRPWRELVAPAVALAREGHELDTVQAADMAAAAREMRELGFDSSARVYLAADGTALQAGERFVQPELGETLALIAEHGPGAFYRGPLGRRIVEGVRALGGIWSEHDLASYAPIERRPLEIAYRGHRVLTMPPPSAGGIVLAQILQASELLALAERPYRSPEAVHLFLEVARRGFADRNYLVADPEFVRVRTAELSSRAYVATRIADIDPARATPSERVRPGDPVSRGHESTETTHYSVVDARGNAVAVTYTLNASFGARVVVPGTGILLNDEMDDFAVKPGAVNLFGLEQGENNAIAPGKRMLSSMTPTIVLEGSRVRAVLGSPGGPTIITTVAQIALALLDHGVPLHEAVRAPRFHHQWLPDQASFEADLDPALVRALGERGHVLAERAVGSIGHAHCIERDPKSGQYVAVADVTRGGGSALAY